MVKIGDKIIRIFLILLSRETAKEQLSGFESLAFTKQLVEGLNGLKSQKHTPKRMFFTV